MPNIMDADKRTLRWLLFKARQPNCSRKWSLRFSNNHELMTNLSLEIMLDVHCISTMNSLEKDTVLILVCTIYNLFCSCDQFHSTQYCFLISFFLFFCVELASLIRFLQIWRAILCLWYYDQLVHLKKEINANLYRHSLCMGVFQTFPPFIWMAWHLNDVNIYRNLY